MAHAPMTRAITVGVDGSPESLAAAHWAAREAARRTLPLHLVHAWLWQPLDVPLAQYRETEERRAQGVLDEALAAVRDRCPGVEVTAEVVSDTPVPALLAAADDAEMLVLGSRGYGALVGYLLGSYGQQVIAAASRPVVSVRAPRGEEPEAVLAPEAGDVVVGQQGGKDESAPVLGFAFATAAARGVGVHAVRAWSLPPLYAYSPGSLRLADEAGGLEPYERKALTEALAPWREQYPDVPVTEHVEIGSGGQVLLSAAAGAGLLVVGRRVRHAPVGPRIGSVAHAALHHAPCPVAVVPHD